MSPIKLRSQLIDEAGWLEDRRGLVTASESSHLLQASPAYFRKTPEQLAAHKAAGTPIPPNAKMRYGSLLEKHILDAMGHILGWQVRHDHHLYASAQHPYMGASPDGWLTGTPVEQYPELTQTLCVVDGVDVLYEEEGLERLEDVIQEADWNVGLEAKAQPSKSRSKWNKGMGTPKHYACQAIHQNVVLGWQVCLLCAKVDAFEMFVHVIRRNEPYEQLLVEACGRFAQTYLGFPEERDE